MPDAQRVALVTGSTSGIGKAIAHRLSADGFFVVVHSRSSVAAGEALAGELGHAGYIQADLADPAQATRLVRETVGRHGRLDVLVNNAGISGIVPHADLRAATPEMWRRIFDTNVIGPWMLITEAEAHLRAASSGTRPSAIVSITSHAGVRPKGASIPYASSKAALNHMTRLLAVSLAPDIRVNAVAPGLVDTPMTAAWTELQDIWKTRAPMRRAAQPADIAAIVSMLIASDYLTGEVILADGGFNLT